MSKNETALILVDVQYDFLNKGSLAVPQGEEVIPVIHKLLPHFPIVVTTQDWHPSDHCSFSLTPKYEDKSWPIHCVQGSHGADIHEDLRKQLPPNVITIWKGTDKNIEAYSGFQGTDLADQLRKQGVTKCVVMGVATDYCVKATALDSQRLEFETSVIIDACRGISEQQVQTTLLELETANVAIKQSEELLAEMYLSHNFQNNLSKNQLFGVACWFSIFLLMVYLL